MKEIPNIPRYYCTLDGKIYSDITKRFLKGSPDKNGYLRVGITVNNKLKSYKIHRLILLTYSPVENSDDFQVNHKNGIKSDNRLDNLEWVTAQENVIHSFRTGLKKAKKGLDSKSALLCEMDIKDIAELYSYGYDMTEISRKLNLSRNSVVQLIRGVRYPLQWGIYFTEELKIRRESILNQIKDSKNGKFLSKEEIEEIYWDRFYKNKNCVLIAKERKLNYSTVRKIVSECPKYHESKVKGRIQKPNSRAGEGNGRNKLSKVDVLNIVKNYSATPISHLSKQYGVSRAVIYDIIKGKTWSHVTGVVYDEKSRK